MKVYRVSHLTETGESAGYTYHLTKADAKNVEPKDDGEIDDIVVINLTLKPQDVIDFLNLWASHPDNG